MSARGFPKEGFSRKAHEVDFATASIYLYGLKTQLKTYGIERMQHLAEALGQPQERFPAIHVAGTNGKGSVCALLEAIYREADYSTGLYTSPHLTYLGERIQINRVPLPPETLAARIPRLRAIAEVIAQKTPHLHPSFFEFMTAMAFESFAEVPVDIALIETGLGGRLDATNILNPALCVITSVGLDHTELLGDTLADIAREKAGIIKQGVPVAIGNLPAEAEQVITAIARERHAPLHRLRDYFPTPADEPACALPGTFQRANAALACLAATLLQERFPVTPKQRDAGLANVRWEGRWQTVPLREGKTLILDATHNAEGARYLDAQLSALTQQSGPLHILCGTTGNAQRAEALLPILARHACALHLLRPNQSRALSFEALEAAIPADFTGSVTCETLEEVFPETETCALGKPGETVVATGSIYLIGEIMARVIPGMRTDGARLQDF